MVKIIKLIFLLVAVGWGLEELFWSQRTIIEVANSQQTENLSPRRPVFSILDKLDEGDDILYNIPLQVGTKDIPYVETRITRDGEKIKISNKKFSEPEKEIALKLLNVESGEIDFVKVTKKGAELISPPGYQIELVERPSGIRWNKWNTPYRVVEPHNNVVLKNKYPEIEHAIIKRKVKNKAGKLVTISEKKQIIREIVYSPYSPDLHLPELVGGGRAYIREVVASAQATLALREVRSRAFPDKLVTEVATLSADNFEHLPLMEQSDFGEFLLDPLKAVERVAVILMTNPGTAYANTCSKANACGWVQYTSPTYHSIRKTYPTAHLDLDFESGAANHLNSMMAAMLLFDYNLKGFMDRHGKNIVNDPRIKEYLAAAYNVRPTTATRSLKAAISKNLPDWISRLPLETKGFITKHRYLTANNLP